MDSERWVFTPAERMLPDEFSYVSVCRHMTFRAIWRRDSETFRSEKFKNGITV